MKIQILLDNPLSWYMDYAIELKNELSAFGEVGLIHRHEDIEKGDILCILACEKIVSKLDLNVHNLVVHESDLPSGKGWSPLTWQILEGKNRIPVVLFEAEALVDNGLIYDKRYIELDGSELLQEIKHKQGQITNEMVVNFVANYPNNVGHAPDGESSFYSRRRPEDSELDVNLSIKDQFNLLRVVDNKRYPAFFILNNKKYVLKIEEDG